jgi:hypothetical protein
MVYDRIVLGARVLLHRQSAEREIVDVFGSLDDFVVSFVAQARS